MNPFRIAFQIVEESNCPLYELNDIFVLTDKSVLFPNEKESCLILIRELTQLLFQFLGADEIPEPEKRYTCSGCTGLIKFQMALSLNATEKGDSGLAQTVLGEREQRIFDLIHRYPLLKQIPAEQLKRFVRCFQGKILRENEYLLRKGEINKYLYLLLSGRVVVEEGAVPITHLGEGDLCGEMSYLGDSRACTSVRAVEHTKLLAIHGDDFGALVEKSKSVQVYMARLLAERLSSANSVRARLFDSCMQGRVNEMAPAELFQVFHLHQKTGVLMMDLPGGEARVVFSEGMIVDGLYRGRSGQDAIYRILREREGLYRFTMGVSQEEAAKPPVGDFMQLLMEGVRRIDEK